MDEAVGKKFGKLTILRRVENDKHRNRQYLCVCDCEDKTEKVVRYRDLKYGRTVSCGCIKFTHNMSNTRIYSIHSGMKYRCCNEKASDYERYGGRGITVCDEWLGKDGFSNFYNWAIDNGYNDELTIDRVDVNGNYEPSNCRWSTRYEQSLNKSTNVFLTIDGVTKTISEWAKEYNLDNETIRDRFLCGDTGKDLIRKPYEKKENA